MKPVFDTLKNVLGFKTSKQIEFDEAMTLILKALGDSQMFLRQDVHDSAGRTAIVHSWGDAAVKINRISSPLRDGCLELAELFASFDEADHDLLRQKIEVQRETAQRFLREGAGLF